MKHRLLQMQTVRGHTFMPRELSAGSVVVDLGAHKGEFSQDVQKQLGCRCIAVEANPELIESAKATPGVEAVCCAVWDAEGELDLCLSENTEASTVLGERAREGNGQSIRVRARLLWDIMREMGVARIDLLKVDIEGAEVALFRSMSNEELRRIGQVAIEFHDFCGLVTAAEVAEVCARLRGAGFDGIRFGTTNKNWLFVRRGAVGTLPRLYVKHVEKRRARGIAGRREP